MRISKATVPDLALLERANAQWGIVRHEHLLDVGLSQDAITRRLASGRLTRLHEEVYAFGHTCLRDEGLWLAAQWACGPDAVLSHLTAAAFHGMVAGRAAEHVHVTTTRRRHSRDGIAVHRVRRLDRVDVFRPGLLAVTTIPRTLVDLADVLDWAEYRVIADRLPDLRLEALRVARARAPNRRGAPLVTRLLEADDAHTRSEFERRYLRFCRTHGLPRPDALNVRVAGHRADCVYEEGDRRLVVELDGRAYHERRGQMRADRRRDSDYQLAGYRILRVIWDDLHPDEAGATADRVRRMLAR